MRRLTLLTALVALSGTATRPATAQAPAPAPPIGPADSRPAREASPPEGRGGAVRGPQAQPRTTGAAGDEVPPQTNPTTDPAETDALLAEASQASIEASKPQSLSIYGFTDFGFNKFYTSDKSQLNTLFPSRAGTFVLGNANLFFDAQPYEDWRSLMEIRFTNLPHGVETSLAQPGGSDYARTNTEVQDFTSPSVRGQEVLGSVIIERIQTEYSVSDALKFTGGYFFTPWGIWNVDHGTPTLISLLLPSFIADGYLPTHTLGAQLSGSFYTGNWELGYHAYVGNNHTPSQVDFRDDKAVGGRLFASSTGSAVKTKFGVSGYWGHESDISKRVVSALPYLAETKETVSAREWMVGADASLDAGPLRLRAEGFVRRIDYEVGKRSGFTPNHYYSDGYVIAAYELPWGGIEPYTYVEAMHWPSALGDTAFIPSVGVNIHFNPAVQLKAQYGHAFFVDLVTHDGRTPSDNDVDNLAARLVVSF
ncbi:MAG TPA: hypothetical protein VHE30_09800 [Polyangiaceae bacterium]|nr:hypothetical protein [Polyangiaceae bacterium]